MKKFTILLGVLALASCSTPPVQEPAIQEQTTTLEIPAQSVQRPWKILFHAEDLDYDNRLNNVKYSLIQDYTGDTLAIFANGSDGGVVVLNMSKRHNIKTVVTPIAIVAVDSTINW